jgi:hypothetical protein
MRLALSSGFADPQSRNFKRWAAGSKDGSIAYLQ